MDGLTTSVGNKMLNTGKTASQTTALERRKDNLTTAAEGVGKTFADTLKDAVGSVNRMQKEADVLMQKLATGESKNIPEVLIAAEKADVALKLMVQVRNKIIDAYQEVMKMQL